MKTHTLQSRPYYVTKEIPPGIFKSGSLARVITWLRKSKIPLPGKNFLLEKFCRHHQIKLKPDHYRSLW